MKNALEDVKSNEVIDNNTIVITIPFTNTNQVLESIGIKPTTLPPKQLTIKKPNFSQIADEYLGNMDNYVIGLNSQSEASLDAYDENAKKYVQFIGDSLTSSEIINNLVGQFYNNDIPKIKIGNDEYIFTLKYHEQPIMNAIKMVSSKTRITLVNNGFDENEINKALTSKFAELVVSLSSPLENAEELTDELNNIFDQLTKQKTN